MLILELGLVGFKLGSLPLFCYDFCLFEALNFFVGLQTSLSLCVKCFMYLVDCCDRVG